jgi:methylase of polypeptide subunit release factors
LNHVEDRIQVHQGDLFGPVKNERFDLILFNPPFFRGEPREPYDRAWRSPDVAERFAVDLSRHLTANGQALVVLSSKGDSPAFLQAFRANDLAIEPMAERDVLSEILTVYRLTSGQIR